MNTQLKEFQDHLLKCKKIVALVGAGLLASSGLPVFRGSQGLWKNYNMIDLATPDAFYVDPGLVWQFYSWRRYAALQAKPNRGHLALAKLSKLCRSNGTSNRGESENKGDDKNIMNECKEQEKDRNRGQINSPSFKFVTITQNVDGLSSRSEHDLQSLYEIHGSLFTLKCTSFMCNYVEKNNFKQPLTKALKDTEFEYKRLNRKRSREEEELGRIDQQQDKENKENEVGDNAIHAASVITSLADNMDVMSSTSASLSPQFLPVKTISEKDLPRCPVCSELLRPGVVWFGESLPLDVITKIDNFIEEDGPVDLILVIGTSGTVYPANSYVERVKYQGGKVAIFNTDIDSRVEQGKVKDSWGFKGDAAELLPLALEPLIGKV